MDTDLKSPSDLLAIAGDWHARLYGGAHDASLRARFEQWLAQDLTHRLAYADVCAAAYALDQQDGAAIGASITDRAVAVVRPRATRRWPAWSAGISLSLAVMLLAWQGSRPLDRLLSDVHSAEAEVREVALPDGSRAWLGADSALAFDFSEHRRTLRLLRGEAYFDVKPDVARPFSVLAGEVTATAVGTRYAVAHRSEGAVSVQVEEGRVAVSHEKTSFPVLEAGQQLQLASDVTPVPTATSLPASAFDWRHGMLVFDEMPAGDAIARLDAYVPGRVLLLGAGRKRAISAAIAATDAPSALLAIAEREGWRVDGVPGVMVVLH